MLGGGLGSMMGAWPPYRRGWGHRRTPLVEVLQSFPVLLLGLALFAALGSFDIPGPFDTGIVVLVIAIAFVNFPSYVRQVRSVLVPFTDAEFVQAAKCSGPGWLGNCVETLHSQCRARFWRCSPSRAPTPSRSSPG